MQSNQWFYFDPQTYVLQSGLQEINGQRYYLNPNHDGTYGKMKTGWLCIDGYWYYFQPETGVAVRGWQTINNKKYYFDPVSNRMAEGHTVISGHNYYFKPYDGEMYTGILVNNNGQLMYFSPETGIRQTTLQTGQHTYQFDPATGFLNTVGMSSGWYPFGDQAVKYDAATRRFVIMNPNTWMKDNDKWYYVQQDGFIHQGWYQIGGSWYFFGDDFSLLTGWYQSHPANNWYYLTEYGAKTGWQKINGNWYYFDPTNAWADKGWQFINGVWYYFDTTNCWLDYQQTLTYNWNVIIGQYNKNIGIAIQQLNGNEYATTNNWNKRWIMASTIKVGVLAELLHNTGGHLNADQQSLATRMIRYSDNDATTTILNRYLGGMYNMNKLYQALGMSNTYTGYRYWGYSTTTPSDQLKLLREIYLAPQTNYLNDESRNYIKSLMGSVSSAQNWGISAGSSQFYVKNGWNTTGYYWNIGSIGYIPGDSPYTIAVYVDDNVAMWDGVQIVERLARVTRQIMG
ncbi:serine hydrolase [[Lactobacillus] timonensis]|uniref:serine hydrolase n=1 Tax=[Lactobacillus] timonensis TaxID=1970790 RepID=UPI0015E11F4C|nr:serine hydrolase [[Lactobacillus] timonensis]